MDDLTYKYENGTPAGEPLHTNKLLAVQDATTNTDLTTDLQPGQQDDNYAYDDIGNLISDVQEEIENIEWTVYGKVKRITRVAQSAKPDLEFGYDPAGNRIRKTVINKTGGTLFARTNNYYYLRDAQGNIMSTYSIIGTETGNEVERTLTVDESSLYGSSRIGTLSREQWLSKVTYDVSGSTPVVMAYTTFIPDANIKDQFRGDKRYELSNHLGNVLAVVSDQRTPEYSLGAFSKFNANVISAQDYYSFGMIQNGRTYNSNSYKFGFNGKIKDDEWSGNTGATYDYGMRIYDSRIARFLSVDPISKNYPWYTPYQFAGNKPIVCLDLDGLEEIDFRVLKVDQNKNAYVNIQVTPFTTSRSNKGVLLIHGVGGKNMQMTPSNLLNSLLGINTSNLSEMNPIIQGGVGGSFTPTKGYSEYYLSLDENTINNSGIELLKVDMGNYNNQPGMPKYRSQEFFLKVPPDPPPVEMSPSINLTPPGVSGYNPNAFVNTVLNEVKQLVSNSQQKNDQITNVTINYPDIIEYQNDIFTATQKIQNDYPNASIILNPVTVGPNGNTMLNISVTGSAEQKLTVQ